jgi:hypothetical protein
VDDKKSYFAFEPQIEIRFTSECARKNGKEDKNRDDPLHTPAATYQDTIFTKFVCGKAEIPESGPEQAAATIFDFGPVRMDFDPPVMEIQPAEEKVYKSLKKQFLAWQNNFKPYQEFCTSHKIQKPKSEALHASFNFVRTCKFTHV